MKSPLLKGDDMLGAAISVDLLITIPFIYYLLIRKSNIPKTTVVPVMIIGLILGFTFLPPNQQTYLNLFKVWVLPIIELFVVTFVLIKAQIIIKKQRELSKSNPDFYDTIQTVLFDFMPKRPAEMLSAEISVIHYGFINWRTLPLQENEFSYHLKSGTPALFGALIMMIAIECIGLHYLLGIWNNIIAWVFTILSVYSMIQVFGFSRSMSKRPIKVGDNSLTLRYGILNQVEIDFSEIIDITISRKPIGSEILTRTLAPIADLEKHNVVISLNTTHELQGIYGFKKDFNVLALHLDDPKRFKESMDCKLKY